LNWEVVYSNFPSNDVFQNLNFTFMNNHTIFLCLLSFVVLAQACGIIKNESSNIAVFEHEETSFPESWLGTWAGTLVISKPIGDTTQVPMQLYYAENDTLSNAWDWHIIYGVDKEKGRRAYTLYEKNAEQGHYVIDENNGIILDTYFVGGSLYSRFAVANNLLTTITRKEGDKIIFEIIAGQQSSINKTGNIGDIPEVESYNIQVQQRAVLSRMK